MWLCDGEAGRRFGLRTNAGRRHLDNRAVRAGFVVEIDRPLQLQQHGRAMATRLDTGGALGYAGHCHCRDHSAVCLRGYMRAPVVCAAEQGGEPA